MTDPDVMIVHVTHFNNLMWDNNGITSTVIDHGIPESRVQYIGDLPRGLVIINNLKERGRRLGLDIFLEARKYVPLDLIGMNTQEVGGLGEILHPQLPEFIAQYRFFFNPTRYTSLGLAVLEAMMVGVPVIGMETTEMVTVFKNGVSGFIHTDLSHLIDKMKIRLEQKELAARIGGEGKKIAMQRFNIKRFTDDWEKLLRRVVARDFNPSISESYHILQQQT